MGHSKAKYWSRPQTLEPVIAAEDKCMTPDGDKQKDPGKDKEYTVRILTEDNADKDAINDIKRDCEVRELLTEPKMKNGQTLVAESSARS